MKEKFNRMYPIVNLILVISTLIFKSIEDILWLLIVVMSIISLFISLKEDMKAKIGIKIFGGITLVALICGVLYKLYKIILYQ